MLDVAKPMFAFARVHKIETLGYLAQQAAHASRVAPTAATRPGARRGHCVSWSLSDGSSGDLVADFKAHKKSTGARERGGASIGMHLLLCVSPEWVAEAGDIHDRFNPRVAALFQAALDFGRDTIGGVFALRLDLDERGGGVVDTFCAPVHERQAKRRKDGTRGPGVREISVKTALYALQKKTRGGKSYESLQTLWAAHACEHLDARLVRGEPVRITGRQHLSVADFRRAAEQAKAHDVRRAGEQALAVNTLLFLGEEQGRIKASERELARREEELAVRQATLDEREDELRRFEATVAEREHASAERQLQLDLAAEWLDEKRMHLTLHEDTILLARHEQDRQEDALRTFRSSLEAREHHIEAAGIDAERTRVELAAASANLLEREQGIVVRELRSAEDREAHDRRVEMFARQRVVWESDIESRWSQVASASAEAEARQEVETQKLAGERVELEARIEEAARRDRRREQELNERVGLLHELETRAAEAAKLYHERAAALEADRRRIETRAMEVTDAEATIRGREAVAQRAITNAATAREKLERDRDDLVAGVTRLVSTRTDAEEPRTRSGWVVEAISMVERAVRAAVRATLDRAAAAERSALNRERAANEMAVANAKRAREIMAFHADAQRHAADLFEQQRDLDREKLAVIDRGTKRNLEVEALRAGLWAIEGGELDQVEKIAGRPDLAPAEPLLKSIVVSIGKRVDQLTRAVRATQEEATKKIEQANAALEAAKRARAAALTRENSASDREKAAADREERFKGIVSSARALEKTIANWLSSAPKEVRDAVGAFQSARAKKSGREIGS